MEADLAGSQALMSGTVQLNLFVKAVFGLMSAGPYPPWELLFCFCSYNTQEDIKTILFF